MTNRGVLWDMDGVLVDTAELHYVSWSHVLLDYGIPFDRHRFRRTFGMNNHGTLAELLGRPPEPGFVAEVGERKEVEFRQAARGNVAVLPGVRSWLQRLQGAGYQQAIASSAPRENIDVLVDELEIRSFFEVLIAGADLPPKPEPAIFFKAARELELRPEQCVVVEDSLAGVSGAKRAGMACIAVTTTNPAEALQMADLVVERLDALAPDAFDRLLSRHRPEDGS
jgi:HAD superfamily hydrolase (TIGR01509 family)